MHQCVCCLCLLAEDGGLPEEWANKLGQAPTFPARFCAIEKLGMDGLCPVRLGEHNRTHAVNAPTFSLLPLPQGSAGPHGIAAVPPNVV